MNTNVLNLKTLLGSIEKLDKNALTFKAQAIELSRQTVLYGISAEGNGNAQPISKLFNAMLALGHKGMAGKYRAWVEKVSPFKLKNGTHSTFNKRTNAPLELRDEVTFKIDFPDYVRPAGKPKPKWSLELAIQYAMQRAIKEQKFTEAQARAKATAIASSVALKIVEAPTTAGREMTEAEKKAAEALAQVNNISEPEFERGAA